MQSMPNTQEQHDKLKQKLVDARKVIDGHKVRYNRVHTELTSIEDDLVSAREAERKAQEALAQFEYTQTHVDADEEDRQTEIKRFSDRLPDLLKRLDDEDKLKAEKKAS
jgi:hypothetical protein